MPLLFGWYLRMNLLTGTVTKFLNVLESLNVIDFLTIKYLPPELCPGQAALGWWGPLMYKLSWIRLITHDIYTLVHSPPPLITYCHSAGLASRWTRSDFKATSFSNFVILLPLSALILQAANMNRELMSLIISRQKNCTRGPKSSLSANLRSRMFDWWNNYKIKQIWFISLM